MSLHKPILSSRWTIVDGMSMHARVAAGPARREMPPVVLVHGLVVSSRYMMPTAERLASNFRVYAPDLPGFGLSSKPSHVLRLPELADALAEWMDAVGLEQAALLGNSFGCQILVEFALRHPDRASRLVLLGPTADPQARTVVGQAARWLYNMLLEPLSLYLVILKDFAEAGFIRLVGTYAALLGDRLEEKLPQVRVPVLVMRGARDPIVPQRWAKEVTRLLPDGRLVVIPDAAHAVNYSDPLAMALATREFLAEDEAKPAATPER